MPKSIVMLEAKIKKLKEKIEKLYETGMWGIEYVGIANYHEREAEARAKLNKVYYDD